MPKYAEEILAAVTELQQHPKAEQVFLEMKREHPSIALGTPPPSDWTALRTGTGYRRRRNGITPCCFISICRITARASPLRLSQSRSGNETIT